MDGWFPRISPSGWRIMRGARQLSIDGVEVGAKLISGLWLSESRVVVRDHATGQLVEGEVSVPVGRIEWTPCPDRQANWLAGPSRDGRYAWSVVERDGTAVVRVTDGRTFRGYGAGMRSVALSPTGWLLMARQTDGQIGVVPPGTEQVQLLEGAKGTELEAGDVYGVYRGERGQLWAVSWTTLATFPVGLPGEEEFWPVIVDSPEGMWLVSHTHDRLLLRPLQEGGTEGYVVETGANSFYPHARWVAGTRSIRVAWSTGWGEPRERTVDLFQPRTRLAVSERWEPSGTGVDAMPFHVPTFTGVLRSADGQTLQMVRTGPREVRCLKGHPTRQEIWQWDDQAIFLVYDATDKDGGQAVTGWRLDPIPVWCRRVARVGEVWEFAPGTVLRRSNGDVHRFEGRTSVWGVCRAMRVGRLGLCQVLVTTWEVGPPGQYQERHWWAIGEDGTRWGRVRYQEYRQGVLTRDFLFDEVVEAPIPEVVPPLPIPVPEGALLPPSPPSPRPKEEVKMLVFPPRNETLAFVERLNEYYRDTLTRPMVADVHVDVEGLAVWVQEYLRWRVNGMPHPAAMELVFKDIQRVVNPEVRRTERLTGWVTPSAPRRWDDATGRLVDLPVVCHYGDGLSQWVRHPARVERHLSDIVSAGYDAVRTWTVLGHHAFWKDREVGPTAQGETYWEAVRTFAELLQRYGLRWLVSQGDLCVVIPRQADRLAFMERLGATLSPFGPLVLGVDGGNEAWQNGEPSGDRLKALVDAFRRSCKTPIWSLTDGAGQETRDALLRYAGSVVDVHGYRGGRWWDKLRHIFTLAYETVPDWCVVQSEPFGPGPLVSVTEHKDELSPGVMQAAQVMAAMTGQLWTYFSSEGIIADNWIPPVPVERGLVTGGSLLHGGTRWSMTRIFEAVGEVRADHVIREDGQWACLIYGPDQNLVQRLQPVRPVNIQEQRSWMFGELRGGARYVAGFLR